MGLVNYLLWLLLFHTTSALCPATQKFVAGKCIQIFQEHMTYHEAQTWCRELKGKLIQIEDRKMLNVLLSLIDDGESYWVDIVEHVKEQLRVKDHEKHKEKEEEVPHEDFCPHIFRGINDWEHALSCKDTTGCICSFSRRLPGVTTND